LYQLRAIIAAIRQDIKQGGSNRPQLLSMLNGAVFAAVYAWIARQSGNPNVSTYLIIGGPLMVMSNRVIFRVGWSLTSEVNSGTLEFSLISQTSMITVFVGKTLAQLVSSLPNALAYLVTIYFVTGSQFTVAEIGLLPFSVLVAIVGVFMVGLFFAPFMTLARGRGGFFNAFMPFAAVLSGFLFPVDRLPTGLLVIARLLPTSWAMDGVWQSIQGSSWLQVATS
jgi:ABC-type uncharacterized transport system permease subunit